MNPNQEGRGAALLGIEGGYAIEDSLETLRAFHRERCQPIDWCAIPFDLRP